MVIKIGAKPTAPPAKPGLLFEAEKHLYRMNTFTNSPEYRRVSGVTTVIGSTLNKPALVDYKMNSVARAVRENLADVLAMHADVKASRLHPFDFDKKLIAMSEVRRDRAAARGTAVHAAAEKVADGQKVSVPKELQKPVDHYDKWLYDNDVEVVLKERPCGNRTHWYAGTFDLICKFHRGAYAGQTWMVDLKTSNQVYGETALQTIAYKNCEFYVDEDQIDRPMPEVEGIGVLHLTKEGAFLHPLGDMQAASDEFAAILLLFNSRKRRDGLIRRAS
ncbi:hypothetical protein [Glutamicibacter ardleyensis]|uniref:PD-(D/E)XK endonuclease-like domain-containing protein n=1 Tax=Glutamicibacter ardleyensis TaxID=225894 RepID=A0ABQ2DFJ7_9MICC|nr:hypothetical protein [Glutamicibacter ardleyensis]GGJ56210.1 hypothetical protein GCM10007173_13780 [Glutamicibacter ardleyensis]